MIKLYDNDSYINEFYAEVLSCEKVGSLYKIVCDKTAFFPTAGGQDCDTGTLGGQNVLSVGEAGDIIYHMVEKPIAVGEIVFGKIDFDVRLRKMQHHSAEHIVSGIVNRIFGYNNVGFHLGEEDVTIDYDGVLKEEDLSKIEIMANEVVTQNIEIVAKYPEKQELEKLSYRSKIEILENVRIVNITGVDICACCAPHVKYTGEIGIIKLKDLMNHRGGTRIRMICAKSALFDYQKKAKSAQKISNLLSAKQDEIEQSVEKLLSENAQLKQKNAKSQKEIARLIVANLPKTDKNLCVFIEDANNDTLINAVNEGVCKCRIFVALSGSDADGYNYVIGSQKVELLSIAKDINQALSGRGGGKNDMLSGKFGTSRKQIEEYFKI